MTPDHEEEVKKGIRRIRGVTNIIRMKHRPEDKIKEAIKLQDP